MKSLAIYLFAYLQSKPKVGIASGFFGSLMVSIQKVLTDELIIKIVVNLGACCSAFVAFMSAMAWIAKQVRYFTKRTRK